MEIDITAPFKTERQGQKQRERQIIKQILQRQSKAEFNTDERNGRSERKETD